MAVLWVLKILHILALALGIGGGVATGIAARLARAHPEAAPALGALQRRIGRASAAALAVLWVTGVAMVGLVYGGALPPSFWLKLAMVLGLTAVVALAQIEARRAAREGRAPAARRIAGYGAAAGAFSTLAVVFAVVSFN